MKSTDTPTSADTDARLARTEQDTETPSSSRMEEGAIPKAWRPGCGCLCLLAPDYLLGLFQLNCIDWSQDRFIVFAYVLAPFLWPVMAAGWLPSVLKIPAALAALYAYGRWLRRAWKANNKKTIFLNILWIFLLFLLSIGGCLMDFDRSFNGAF